ncbi:MAG: oligosaccharide flippase family protein [Pelagimonas sp.]|jgi:O-antigen/teichoic acid export membrane protein|nr:oligosaccharide flippase family protein [Pelagimonas sp.]
MIARFWTRLTRSDTARVTLGNGLGAGLGFVVLMVMTRSLGAEGYGAIAPALAIMDMGQLLIDTLLAAGVVTVASRAQEAPEGQAQADHVLATGTWLRIAGGLIYAALFVLGAAWLAPLMFPGQPNGAALVRLAGLTGGMLAMQSALIGGLQIRQRFGAVAISAAMKNLFRLLAVGLCFGLGWVAPLALGAALTLAGLVALMAVAVVGAPGYLRRVRPEPNALRDILGINKWMVLASLAIVSGRIDVLILSAWSSPRDVAFYAGAMQLCIGIGILSQAIVTTQLPKVAKYSTNQEVLGYIRRWAGRLPLALAPVALMPFVASWIVSAVLGPDFGAAGPVFAVLFASSMITLVMNPVLLLLFPMGSARLFGLTALGQVAAKWGLAVLVIAGWGALGLAFADVVTKIAASALVLGLLMRRLRHGKEGFAT